MRSSKAGSLGQCWAANYRTDFLLVCRLPSVAGAGDFLDVAWRELLRSLVAHNLG